MTLDRRELLQTGLGLTATFACPADSALSAEAGPSNVSLEVPPVRGEFDTGTESCAAMAGDFGNIVHRRPSAVLRPESARDISSLMRWAARKGVKKVTARGQGHSIYGRSLAEGGVVIDMRTLKSIRHVEADHIIVDAGASWESVLEATLPRGLAPPVLTNYLGLSVGGTLAVGGIGGSSSRHGMQTDHALSLDIVTGGGEELTCSATSHSDLFDMARAGLGQCGVITRATLRLVRAPQRVRRFQLTYPDLGPLTADQFRLLDEDRFDQLQGAALPDGAGGWRYQLDAAVFHDSDADFNDAALLESLSDERENLIVTDLTFRDDAQAFAKLEKMLRLNGQWANPKPWFLSFLPGSVAQQVAREVLGVLDSEEIGPFGRITYYPMHTDAGRTPLVQIPAEKIVFPFNVIRFPLSGDTSLAMRTLERNRALYERIRGIGGTQYPVGAFPMSHDDWRDHFGAMWPRLRDAKCRYDPANLLSSGYDLF